jgi:hypothetical protein
VRARHNSRAAAQSTVDLRAVVEAQRLLAQFVARSLRKPQTRPAPIDLAGLVDALEDHLRAVFDLLETYRATHPEVIAARCTFVFQLCTPQRVKK